jgi:hypothetical protein
MNGLLRMVLVQVLDTSADTWRTVGSVLNRTVYINHAVREAARRFRHTRDVRAVDSHGNVLYALPGTRS